MQKHFKPKLRWLWAALAVVIGSCLGIGWLMFQHIPSWYQPIQITPADVQNVKDDLITTFDELSESMVKSNARFERRLTQDQINSWLTILEKIWPASRNWLPESVTDPFISIDTHNIRLAATYRRGKLNTVLSAQIEAQVTQKGIMLRLVEVSGGSISTPQSWVRDRLDKMDRSVWPADKQPKYQYGNDKLPKLGNLYEGILFPNAWVWQNGKQPFRIIDLKLEPGAVVFTFEPLPRHSSRRLQSQTASAPATSIN